jgi:hypothetical protein
MPKLSGHYRRASMGHIQISKLIDHSNPRAILAETKNIFLEFYPETAFNRIESAFENILRLFNGEYRDFMACNTEYHDLNHTLDVFLASARLLDGRNLSGNPFSLRLASELLQAALLHDTGYIQKKDDTSGTGAKYTVNHVERGIDFAATHMADFGIEPSEFNTIKTLIACTGLRNRWEDFTFTDSDEMIAGTIIATADLLGQMSDRAYLEKLLFLYYEFREAGIEGYNTEFDILRKTLDFYEITQTRLADESTNFRHKLKRLDIESAEAKYRC